jgi:RNA polymerase sigma-70 factor (ECF subfamily)
VDLSNQWEEGIILEKGKEQDSVLVEKTKQGDREAFGKLMEKYKHQVYFIAYRMTNSHADADDLSQEAFIKAYRAIGRFRQRASFSTWIYRIAVNTTINYLKKIKCNPIFELDENIFIENNPSTNPRKMAEDRELHEKITEAINSLPIKQKVVVELAILEGLPHKKVAKILGCPVNTVSWRLFHARKKIKEKLKLYV